MADRWTSNFDILDDRQPVKRSSVGSILRDLTDSTRIELIAALEVVSGIYDGRLINTSYGGLLDKHGVKLDLPRGAGENDDRYLARLLTQFQTIPDGLTDAELYDAVFAVTTPDVPVITQWYKNIWEWPQDLTARGSFGLNTIGADTKVIPSAAKAGCKFALTEDALITTMQIAVAPSDGGSRNVWVAIYDDDGVGGLPGTGLALSSDSPITVATAAWYEFAIDIPLASGYILTPGDYWLAINVNGGDLFVSSQVGSTDQCVGNLDIPPPDASFGTPAPGGYEEVELSAYATYIAIDPTYVWEKWMNKEETRFTVSVVLPNSYTSEQLDTIEANVRVVKPAHLMVRIVRDMTTYHELLREIA